MPDTKNEKKVNKENEGHGEHSTDAKDRRSPEKKSDNKGPKKANTGMVKKHEEDKNS